MKIFGNPKLSFMILPQQPIFLLKAIYKLTKTQSGNA